MMQNQQMLSVGLRLLLLGTLTSSSSWAFRLLPTTALHPRTAKATCATRCYAVPELILANLPTIEMGIVAAASAVAGAMSQQPRIQQLSYELQQAKLALNETATEMEAKLFELNDKLFIMDQEYEAQTARFKQQYDDKMKVELQQLTEKIKTDFQYKLEIRLDQQRSEALSKKLDKVNGITDREAEISQMRIARDRMQEANRQLEQALKDSEDEIQRIRNAKQQKPIFGWFQ